MKNGRIADKIRKLPGLRLILNGTFTGTGTIVSVAVVLIIAAATFFSKVEITLGESGIKAGAMLVSPVEVGYEQIDEVTLHSLSELELGERGRGFTSLYANSGSYINQEFGVYDIYVSRSNKENYILIRYSEICYMVVNRDTAADTEALFEQLSQRVE